MFLSHVDIANFRGIASLNIAFHSGINVLIGENATCKTAVLDALRLGLSFALEQRDLYVDPQDFYTDDSGNRATAITIALTFSGVEATERGAYYEMLDVLPDGVPVLRLHVRFTSDGDRIRRTVSGGAGEGQPIPPQVLELLYYTHLGALRDATRDLSPRRANRLSQLFLKLIPEIRAREALAAALNTQVRAAADWQAVLNRATQAIQNHLGQIVLQGDNTTVGIEFVDATFREIVEELRLYIPRQPATKGDPTTQTTPVQHRFSIAQNSLGYNNLLYIAAVLGDLIERKQRQTHSYAALLIEEPEAHLHPHWQNTLFRYLNVMQEHRVQVFVSSHSPTITAKSELDALIVLRRNGQELIATPIRRLPFSEGSKRYLQRFLDVTKSQLFFARAVILVEGISEALLLPTFAKLMGDAFDLDKNGIEVINIGGVAFAPFAELFNSAAPDQRLGTRCAIITDDDRGAGQEASARAAKALDLRSGLVEVFLGRETFEYELCTLNPEIMRSTYQELHPRTDLSPASGDDYARAFVEKIKANEDKAILAQRLAGKVSDQDEFVVPDYIRRAIRWATGRNVTTN